MLHAGGNTAPRPVGNEVHAVDDVDSPRGTVASLRKRMLPGRSSWPGCGKRTGSCGTLLPGFPAPGGNTSGNPRRGSRGLPFAAPRGPCHEAKGDFRDAQKRSASRVETFRSSQRPAMGPSRRSSRLEISILRDAHETLTRRLESLLNDHRVRRPFSTSSSANAEDTSSRRGYQANQEAGRHDGALEQSEGVGGVRGA